MRGAGVKPDNVKPDQRKLLLAVGEKLFSRHGYREVNVERICDAAGLATGSFYTYFPSKESLYAEIVTRLEERGIKTADRIVGSLRSPLNQLKALYRFTTLGIQRTPVLKGLFTGDRKYTFPGWHEHTGAESVLHRHMESLISRILTSGTRQRVFRSGRYRDPTRLILSIFDTILANLDAPDNDVLLEDILTLLQHGLKRTLRLARWEEYRDRERRRRRLAARRKRREARAMAGRKASPDADSATESSSRAGSSATEGAQDGAAHDPADEPPGGAVAGDLHDASDDDSHSSPRDAAGAEAPS